MGMTAESAADARRLRGRERRASPPCRSARCVRLVRGDGGWVVFCSSSALAAPPRDWPHYVRAKAALEGLAGWVAETSPRLRTVILRPPAMRTEMTNTPSGRIAPVATETIAAWVADRLGRRRAPGRPEHARARCRGAAVTDARSPGTA